MGKEKCQADLDDIIRLFQQLVEQTGGNVDEKSPLVLALSPAMAALLAGLNDLGNRNVLDMLKGYFTNLRIVSAVQYGTNAGEMMQLICTNLEAQDSVWLGFSEKFYAFAPVRKTSSYIQKFRAGTFGAIIRRPAAVASMLGM